MTHAQAFDVDRLYAALDGQRRDRGLSWSGVARDVWAQSAVLNALRDDHPIAASTITALPTRGDTSCQHVLFVLRWLGRPPEDFIAEPAPGTGGVPLPETDETRRLRWSLRRTYEALDAARQRHGATWADVANRLQCSPNQLTGLRTARFATSTRLAMRICQGLGRPAAHFVYAAQW